MSRIQELVKKIAEWHGITFEPAAIKPRLDEIVSQLPLVPPDLQEYLDHCLQAEGFGSLVEFHGAKTLIEENEMYVPGADVIKQGFLCFAKEGDGSQFAYCSLDGKVYHISEEAGETTHETMEGAYRSWGSLQDFLLHCVAELDGEV